MVTDKKVSCKNIVVDFLDNLQVKKKTKADWSSTNIQANTDREIQAEIYKRLANKLQKKETKDRHKLDRLLRSCDTGSLDISKQNEFGDLEVSILQTVKDIHAGKTVGHQISHIWYDEDTPQKTSTFEEKWGKLL